jgi:hypothetical protein
MNGRQNLQAFAGAITAFRSSVICHRFQLRHSDVNIKMMDISLVCGAMAITAYVTAMSKNH